MMITKILASTAAISFALTATTFAQDKSADKPKPSITETKAKVSDGEDRLTENLSIAGGGGGKVDVQDINIVKYAKDPKLDPIKGESQDKVAGSGGEDRLTENVTLNVGKAPACVTESGAVDADCSGVPDSDAEDKDTRFDRRDIRKRPEPRQQRR